MDLSAALTPTIYDLSVGVDRAVSEPSMLLSQDLKLAVHAYMGLRLVWVGHHQDLTLTAFLANREAGEVMTSLRLPLHCLAPEFSAVDLQSTITFYADIPGAFVDLAADLTHALRLPGPTRHARHHSSISQAHAGIVIDDDLTPASMVSGLTGVVECTNINQVLGMLIGSGIKPDDADHELDRRAEMAGVTPAVWATRQVRAANGSPPPSRAG